MSTPVWSEDTLRGALRITAKTECQAIGVEWDQLRSLIESHLELHRQAERRERMDQESIDSLGTLLNRKQQELDQEGENADYWRKRANELGAELDELRSAARALLDPPFNAYWRWRQNGNAADADVLNDFNADAARLTALVAPSVPETPEETKQ